MKKFAVIGFCFSLIYIPVFYFAIFLISQWYDLTSQHIKFYFIMIKYDSGDIFYLLIFHK